MNEGKLYEMQPDNTYTLYRVKYDSKLDLKNRIFTDFQVPTEKEFISSGHIIKKWTHFQSLLRYIYLS